jgi:hypothetical protein
MTDPFADPSSSAGLDYHAVKGCLLLFEVTGTEDHVPTVHTQAGEKTPAVRANVYVIDAPEGPVEYVDTLVFPKVLQSQLRSQVGVQPGVLGRLAQGEAKGGKNAPWQLLKATEDDKRIAVAYLQQRDAAAFASPTQTAQAPF